MNSHIDNQLLLDAIDIYSFLVRINDDGDYCYYLKPWTEKIYFKVHPSVIRFHDEGALRSLTLEKKPGDYWVVKTWSRYPRINSGYENKRSGYPKDFNYLI